jgi:hypothetical protein
MTLRHVIFGWDLLLALLGAICMAVVFPAWLPTDFAKDLYGVGISVLSILFAVYFAALAIIMASSDDEFVTFLDEQGDYTLLIATFKMALFILFCALLVALCFYTYTSFRIANHFGEQRKWWVVGFGFLFLWGLFAAFLSTRDAILYSKYRSRFLALRRNNRDLGA